MPKTRARSDTKPAVFDHEHIVLVFQGGGALGAYQAGVFEEIADFPREPTWVAGVSIGAINAALIAGNPRDRRVERLREFWELVSSSPAGFAPLVGAKTVHQFGAFVAASTGVPGFFAPRFPPPYFRTGGAPEAISFYDTTPLIATLGRLADFDLINDGPMRLSVGAVDVETGDSMYFDNRGPRRTRIEPEHVMASGALPPAFAPVIIDGHHYWDGGILSNTPVQYVLDHRGNEKIFVAQVDLFSACGSLPADMPGVMSRQKEIIYSSRARYNTDKLDEIQQNKKTALDLIAMLPAADQKRPAIRALKEANRTARADIVHLIYRVNESELESRDYDFSREAMLQHWTAGRSDMRATIEHPDWLRPATVDDGIVIYELKHDQAEPKPQRHRLK
jgi:NTE family protein